MGLGSIYSGIGLAQGIGSIPEAFVQGQQLTQQAAMNAQKMDLASEQLMDIKSQRRRTAQAMKDAEELEKEEEAHNKNFLNPSRRWAEDNTTSGIGNEKDNTVITGMGAPRVAFSSDLEQKETLGTLGIGAVVGEDATTPLDERLPAEVGKKEVVKPPSMISLRQSSSDLEKRWLRLYTLTGDERYKKRSDQVKQNTLEGFKNILTGAFLAGDADVVAGAISDIYGVQPKASFAKKGGQTILSIDLGKGQTMDLTMAQVLNLDKPEVIASMEWTMEQKRLAYEQRQQNTMNRINSQAANRIQADVLASAPYYYLARDSNDVIRKFALLNDEEAQAAREQGHQVLDSKSTVDKNKIDAQIKTSQDNATRNEQKRQQEQLKNNPYVLDDGSGVQKPIGAATLRAILEWKTNNPTASDADLQRWLDSVAAKMGTPRVIVRGLVTTTSKETIDETGKTRTQTKTKPN